jgi:hypothetical protein
MTPLLLLLALGAAQPRDTIDYGRLFRDVVAIDRDWTAETYLRAARRLAERPDAAPANAWHLARAAARTGDTTLACASLARLAASGAALPMAGDGVTESLRAKCAAPFATLDANARPLSRSTIAFRTDSVGLVAEQVERDPRTGAFLLGSIARRAVYRVDARGRVTPLVGTSAGLGQVIGMEVDARRGVLWIASHHPARDGGPPRAELVGVSADDGRVVRRVATPTPDGPHLLNDIVIIADTMYATDSFAGAVYRLPLAASADTLLPLGAGGLAYPNGIAPSPDGRALVVATAWGLVRVPRDGGAYARVAAPPGASLASIDGLYLAGGALVGVQNALGFSRAVRLATSAAGDTVSAVDVLESRHPAHALPTTGVLSRDTLFYVANSQVNLTEPSGRLRDGVTPQGTVVLALPLRTRRR